MSQHGKVVYIGSIPYDQTEEQVLQIVKSVGPVCKFKLMFDKTTGKSKGFAFVEYVDLETAKSAVRNLNNYPIGNRSLKCDFSFETSVNKAIDANKLDQLSIEEVFPPLPPGVQLNPDQNVYEAVSTILSSTDEGLLLRILDDMQLMAQRSPRLMQYLLQKKPQLTYTIIELLLSFGYISSQQIESILH
ncbi:Rna15p ASCRUDRAFT_24375, partial [Ascoidea rubescens DSM 1968]